LNEVAGSFIEFVECNGLGILKKPRKPLERPRFVVVPGELGRPADDQDSFRFKGMEADSSTRLVHSIATGRGSAGLCGAATARAFGNGGTGTWGTTG
jgi:hypothetical protein